MPPGWGPRAVVITATDFENGRLPAICAVTGAPAGANLVRRYSTTPGWVGCLFFISWAALFVAYLFTHQGVTGRLPVIASIAARVNRLHRTGSLLFAGGIVGWLLAVLLGVATHGTVATVAVIACLALGTLAFAVAIVASFMESSALGIRGRVTKDGFGTRWVQLQGVHPAFVQAVANTRR
jgi:hypothetical protein